jgi:hypothetical protein
MVLYQLFVRIEPKQALGDLCGAKGEGKSLSALA